jgi:hypothetical protein
MTDQPRDPETGQFVSRSEATGEAGSTEDVLELTAAEQVDLTMRQTLAAILGENIAGSTDDNDFDYYEVFEWDDNPGVDQFYALALRNPYAFAVTFLPPSTTWRDPPEIVDDGEANTEDGQTAFEQAVTELEREAKLWHYCKRADKLAGIGQFGVLVLEFDDVEDPGAWKNPATSVRELKGLRPFSEASIEDVKLGGPASGRWGKPVKYQIDLSDEEDDESDATITEDGPDSIWVHHTRVIHIPADELLDDEVRGIPRQQPVYNNLIEIERTLGSAGQLVYRAAAWGININIDKDFDLDDGGDDLREHLHRWEVGLENVLRTHGAKDVQSLGGEDIDPGPVIDPNVEAISAQTGLPQSVLKGNETGERATTQDLKEWYGKIAERRTEFATPTIVRALIDRLREYDLLPDPSGDGYSAEWPPLHETSEKEVADIQKARAEVLDIWTGGVPDAILTRQQQADFIEDGTLPSELDELVDEVAEFEDVEAAATDVASVDEMATALADGGQEVSDNGE